MGVTLQDMISRCHENKLKYTVINVGAEMKLLVLERGGRVFGPFIGESKGVFWANNIWNDTESFRTFLHKHEWNTGGDRIWIGPEIQFHIQNRQDVAHSEQIPSSTDPGSYRLRVDNDKAVLRQKNRLKAYNIAQGTIALGIEKTIRPAANPLRKRADAEKLLDEVEYCGYTQKVTLKIRHGGKVSAEAWNITQVDPPGDILIPVTDAAEYIDFYDPIDDNHLQNGTDVTRLKATGDCRYKVGLKAAQVQGDILYFGEQDGKPYLYVKRFFSNPSADHAEESAALLGENGFSTYVYNDDGRIGGFSELECNLQPVGGTARRLQSCDVICNWFFFGETEKLDKIMKALTGKSGVRFHADA